MIEEISWIEEKDEDLQRSEKLGSVGPCCFLPTGDSGINPKKDSIRSISLSPPSNGSAFFRVQRPLL